MIHLPIPIQNVSSVSEVSEILAKNTLAALKAQKKLDLRTIPEKSGVVGGKFIRLKEAMASGNFSYHRMGLYTEADTDRDYGRIWVKEEFENPKTGQKEEWLVVYTNDDDEIIRQVANEKRNSLAKIAADVKEPAKEKPAPKQIAPGIKSKNITMDQDADKATAKVTFEFKGNPATVVVLGT